MRARVALAVLVLASALPAAGRLQAATPTASAALATPPQGVVSSGWAGIWQVNEETRDCTTQALISTASYLDTLCTGDAFNLLASEYATRGGIVYPTCSGPGFTDAALNLTCSVAGVPCGYMGTCSATYTYAAVWARNGDQATTTLTYQWTRSGPGLPPPNEGCQLTTGTRTRIATEATACGAVPTLPRTWGSLKILYR